MKRLGIVRRILAFVLVFVISGMALVPTASARTIVDSASGRSVTLMLYRDHEQDTTPFSVTNMFPGDAESKAYFLRVSYRGSVDVHFRAEIRSGYEKLAEVLKCRVALRDGAVLYDGLMKDMPQRVTHSLPASVGTSVDLVYDITAYLDTSVGNDYMAKELIADFIWWVEDEAAPAYPSVPDDPDAPASPDQPQTPGQLIPPETGDGAHFCLWFFVAILSLMLNLVLLFPKFWKTGGKKEGKKTNA